MSSVFDGNINFSGGINNFIGHNVHFAPGLDEQRAPRSADVGVVTVLAEETRAVRESMRRMFDYQEQQLAEGPIAAEAWLPDRSGKRVRVAAIQTLAPGTNQAALSSRALLESYHPAVVLLVGVAGGISEQAGPGDVVVSDQVVFYDMRREHRRETAHHATALIRYRINDFLAQTPPGGRYRIISGTVLSTVGTGDAAVVRQWLTDANDKVLAIEMEAAGVSQALRSAMRENADQRGWLSIRGISDHMNTGKGNADDLRLAAEHAAEVMAMLVPFLSFEEQ